MHMDKEHLYELLKGRTLKWSPVNNVMSTHSFILNMKFIISLMKFEASFLAKYAPLPTIPSDAYWKFYFLLCFDGEARFTHLSLPPKFLVGENWMADLWGAANPALLMIPIPAIPTVPLCWCHSFSGFRYSHKEVSMKKEEKTQH